MTTDQVDKDRNLTLAVDAAANAITRGIGVRGASVRKTGYMAVKDSREHIERAYALRLVAPRTGPVYAAVGVSMVSTVLAVAGLTLAARRGDQTTRVVCGVAAAGMAGSMIAAKFIRRHLLAQCERELDRAER